MLADQWKAQYCLSFSLGALQSKEVCYMPERQAELLIEVAVVDSPVPAHRDCVTAHHALCCCWVEGVHQQLHSINLVIVFFMLLLQCIMERAAVGLSAQLPRSRTGVSETRPDVASARRILRCPGTAIGTVRLWSAMHDDSMHGSLGKAASWRWFIRCCHPRQSQLHQPTVRCLSGCVGFLTQFQSCHRQVEH